MQKIYVDAEPATHNETTQQRKINLNNKFN